MKSHGEAHAEAGGSDHLSRQSVQEATQKLEGQLNELHLGPAMIYSSSFHHFRCNTKNVGLEEEREKLDSRFL